MSTPHKTIVASVPQRCQSCAQAVNALNGRYCKHLRKLVAYHTEPPCETDNH